MINLENYLTSYKLPKELPQKIIFVLQRNGGSMTRSELTQAIRSVPVSDLHKALVKLQKEKTITADLCPKTRFKPKLIISLINNDNRLMID